MFSEAKFQIGKQGITEGTIESLKLVIKNHKRVRISVLKSAGRDREEMKVIAQRLCDELGNCVAKVIGFTIILIKVSKKSLDSNRK